MSKVVFTGTILTVKARIRLLRSFDQIPTHQYQGYTLVIEGEVNGEPRPQFKIAVGPKAHEERQFRLAQKTCEAECFRCPFGLTMATEIILDHWNPSKVKWRMETHCYGPHDCPRYKSGPPYKVQGRKIGMVYTDDDVERAAEEGIGPGAAK